MKRSFKKKKVEQREVGRKQTPDYNVEKTGAQDGVRLNKYIANAGVCSRREADKLIEGGEIKINDKVVTEMGYKVQLSDKVFYQGKKLSKERFVYVLLNKPKDYITTTNDPENRRTVMSLVRTACDERIFPVGRLDRNTTGLLFLTNDGDLADRLAHPSNEIRKVYQVSLDKPLEEEDFNKILSGLILEDGLVKVDDLAMIDDNPYEIGIELHVGRNRIVRRIFDSLGYEVVRLDRVLYAGLTKKDLPRGKWRYLKEMELVRLFGEGKKKSKKKKG